MPNINEQCDYGTSIKVPAIYSTEDLDSDYLMFFGVTYESNQNFLAYTSYCIQGFKRYLSFIIESLYISKL